MRKFILYVILYIRSLMQKKNRTKFNWPESIYDKYFISNSKLSRAQSFTIRQSDIRRVKW